MSNIKSQITTPHILIFADARFSAAQNDRYTIDIRRIYEGYTKDRPVFTVTATEENKSIETVQALWSFLHEHHATRHSVLINIGGGTICDIGGFAAATYMRGIDYINIPTTLLAMVDAAHGGKTGINFCGIKNMVGAFRQPVKTIIEPAFLSSLPTRDFLSGYAELLKIALLDSDDFLSSAIAFIEDFMEQDDNSKIKNQKSKIKNLIDRAISIKQHYVSSDPTEQGLRKALNLGHTIGHALEELSNNQSQITNHKSQITHGYAVLYGLVAELYLAQLILPNADHEPLRLLSRVLIDYYGKPTCSCKDYDQLIELMRSDKKNASADAISFTLLQKVGDPVINQVATPSQIREALDYLFNL